MQDMFHGFLEQVNDVITGLDINLLTLATTVIRFLLPALAIIIVTLAALIQILNCRQSRQ